MCKLEIGLIPTAVKEIDQLTETERNVYLMIVYLKDRSNNDNENLFSDDLIKAYKELYGQEIDTETLYETLHSLQDIEIDFSNSRFNDFPGIPILGIYDNEICMFMGDFYPIVDLFKATYLVYFNEDNTLKSFELGVNNKTISRRAVMAVFEKDKDVRLWKIIRNNEEEGDMSFHEFNEMQFKLEELRKEKLNA